MGSRRHAHVSRSSVVAAIAVVAALAAVTAASGGEARAVCTPRVTTIGGKQATI